MGFIAPRTTTGWPLVMPPSSPPALLVPRVKPRLRRVLLRCVEADFVVDFRAGAAGGFEAEAELDAFECLNADDGGGDARIEPAVPGHAAAEADRAAEDMRFDDSAGGVFGHLLLVDELLHRGVGLGVGAVDFGRVAEL